MERESGGAERKQHESEHADERESASGDR